MARLTRLATTREVVLDDLLRRREVLVAKITSGVAEVEQPQIGRTQYRTMEAMQQALAMLDQLIAQASGDTAAINQKRRRPIYPVVQEY